MKGFSQFASLSVRSCPTTLSHLSSCCQILSKRWKYYCCSCDNDAAEIETITDSAAFVRFLILANPDSSPFSSCSEILVQGPVQKIIVRQILGFFHFMTIANCYLDLYRYLMHSKGVLIRAPWGFALRMWLNYVLSLRRLKLLLCLSPWSLL